MAPKKTKTGGKKKGTKSKGTKKAVEPKLSSMERFIQFSIQTRVDHCTALRQRRDELRAEDKQLNAQLETLRNDQLKKYSELRQSSMGQADQMSDFELQLDQKLQAVMHEKNQLVRELDNEVKALRIKLDEIDQDVVHRNHELQGLKEYAAVGQSELEKNIEVMRATIADMTQEHSELMQEFHDDFQASKERFTNNLSARMQRTKHRATEHAIARQGPREKAEHADRVWLRRELDTHSTERDKLEASCLQLEEENLRMLARLQGPGDLDTRFSSLEQYKRHSHHTYQIDIDDEDEDEDEDDAAEGHFDDDEGDEDEGEGEDENEDEDEEHIHSSSRGQEPNHLTGGQPLNLSGSWSRLSSRTATDSLNMEHLHPSITNSLSSLIRPQRSLGASGDSAHVSPSRLTRSPQGSRHGSHGARGTHVPASGHLDPLKHTATLAETQSGLGQLRLDKLGNPVYVREPGPHERTHEQDPIAQMESLKTLGPVALQRVASAQPGARGSASLRSSRSPSRMPSASPSRALPPFGNTIKAPLPAISTPGSPRSKTLS
ncbi:uncharacterized protein MONBRDRAFT_30341 [Monosiga brevicollis MX1]|uniref:Uncharacterized protein n=1 Tax=Monosiga brevicollis TaxID=81824 RepID=A9VDP7_MONBE|nr:uncharacterized protein MONBRDRAFT_30341 [Monosiga brevicollis MX1]EDQ84357.1 predicted protein [Monosiga brevicollis MX1]|eukprot:XP_001750853.1 hypothetical protein [Monosiga brevicollis MX1]